MIKITTFVKKYFIAFICTFIAISLFNSIANIVQYSNGSFRFGAVTKEVIYIAFLIILLVGYFLSDKRIIKSFLAIIIITNGFNYLLGIFQAIDSFTHLEGINVAINIFYLIRSMVLGVWAGLMLYSYVQNDYTNNKIVFCKLILLATAFVSEFIAIIIIIFAMFFGHSSFYVLLQAFTSLAIIPLLASASLYISNDKDTSDKKLSE